ncbi:P-loop containing nucleoside triphosphate hydrolase protein [Cristinia sonorae]|uniref:P-loop containing nucleoside triphosphate hydrolase protein n=1 Tax=Cristinia sonorae TaxID=1940300 RepID=A0A8K0XUP5_9AGAR|nr:P-loop containing nucleoside triphosphate hydrolase protein [Cristinia sonorae]
MPISTSHRRFPSPHALVLHSPSMSRAPCHFYGTRGGCRRGTSCHFRHGSDTKDKQSSPSAPSPSSPTTASTAHAGGPPPGVCNFYWQTGDCARGFRCRASHTINPARAAVAPTATVASSIPAELAPFLTDAGLARMGDMSTDVFFAASGQVKSPADVHNFLKRFLYDNYQFRSALDAHSFLGLLVEANTNNPSWTAEDGQLLLNAVAKDNGYKRMADILSWPEVSATGAGNNKHVLSFQRGYVPLLQYLASDFVTKSVLSHLTNALYVLLVDNLEGFSTKVENCLKDCMLARSFGSRNGGHNTKEAGGVQIFGSLAMVLLQVLTRIKNITAKEPKLQPFIHSINDWCLTWIEGVTTTPTTFADTISRESQEKRLQLTDHIARRVSQVVSIVDREANKLERAKRPPAPAKTRFASEAGVLAALHNIYEGPGETRVDGPRHDNDFIDISDIRIAPTHEELVCKIPPFLPANLYGAPHPHEPGSVQLLQDIQFRLLREELTASLRTSIQAVQDDLSLPQNRRRTQLAEVMTKRGGKYRGQGQSGDTLLFNVYTGVLFTNIAADFRGISARSRQAFWEGASGKRLLSGGLIALVWQQGDFRGVHLGIISSSLREHVDSSKQDPNRIAIRVNFFDRAVELRILQELHTPADQRNGLKLLVEATVMFESIRPFLEALRVEPTTIPLTKYLVHQPNNTLNTMPVDPPRYSRARGYSFELSSLFPNGSVDSLKLFVENPDSVATAREELRNGSCLDPSQADAIVDALTRELALIQGPPGTGKSYTGKQLIRVLLANKAGPILMIAFTNHALDHMLSSVLEAGITQKICRLGSRSADETISHLSLENMEKLAGQSRLNRGFASLFYNLKTAQQEIEKFMKAYLKPTVASESILGFMNVLYPVHHEYFVSPPPWISLLYRTRGVADEQWQRVGKAGKTEDIDTSLYAFWLSGGDLEFLHAVHVTQAERFTARTREAETSGSVNSFDALAEQDDPSDDSDASSLPDSIDPESEDEFDDDLPLEERWQRVPATDTHPQHHHIIQRATRKQPAPPSPPRSPSPVRQAQNYTPEAFHNGLHPSDIRDLDMFFAHFGIPEIPIVPLSNRPLELLLEEDNVWSFSLKEREVIGRYWSNETRQHLQESQQIEFETLRKKHGDALNAYNEGKAAARAELLRNVDIIGCTTTGAAKLTSLLKVVGPKVMLVEEAGQVLEAHVLGTLVPSVQHLVLIGDPLQLRPTIETYPLSMDHHTGGQLYKFDMSLMERLSSSGLAMSQINVQRRMRPQVSSLIRNYLYPNLEDHELVNSHPDVRGMAKNVFFLSHDHKENAGEDDSVSKFNQYEVDMVVDLVMHLLRQGTYSAEGDIVVLCAYLGQLARMRDALSDKVAVVIDERDQAQLVDQEGEKEEDPLQMSATVDHVKVSKQVRLRTIDNYQGEEAKIVILTLVRNSGGNEEDNVVHGHSNKGRVNVGFLKSENRTNVALSRAREGLYILGNGPDLTSRSKMWRSVLNDLEKDGCVGGGFPVVCAQHKDDVQYVSKPGQLPRIAPDGEAEQFIFASIRTEERRSGGCLRQCNARLRCGHACPYKCHSDDPNHLAVQCDQECTKLCVRGHPCTKRCAEECGQCTTRIANVELPCGHIKNYIACYQRDDLENVTCDVTVRKQLPHCEHEVDTRCSVDPATIRCTQLCNGIMKCCGRTCNAKCYQCQLKNADEEGVIERTDHVRHPCEKRLYCEHLCGKACSEDHECATQCKDACRQVCAHTACNNYCSTPCAPCQEPCTWTCAHYTCPVPCGSVCARLPCDKRCDQTLSCGHRCPSVCGENCDIQVCPLCASEDVANAVVDLILHRTIADVDPDMETVDEMLITIPNCGHAFTVETLDGICDMPIFYQRSEDDTEWIGLCQPPPGFLKPPTCPTCRAAITCPRYGRIFKRADLDILENNVASAMSQSLEKVADRIRVVSARPLKEMLIPVATDLRSHLKKPEPNGNVKERKARRTKILKENRRTPLALPFILPNNNLHGVPISEVKPWKAIVEPLFTAYKESCHIASTRSAHVRAWEASFSYLYKREMDLAAAHPSMAPRNPQEYAMRMAKMNVGQPQPRADVRFSVEAFWLTINVRLILVDLAKAWTDELASSADGGNTNRRLWDGYVSFLLKSCKQDAETTLGLTQESESRRQTVRTRLLMFRIELEQFRFNVDMMRRAITFDLQTRMDLADRAYIMRKESYMGIQHVAQSHLRTSRNDTEWLKENFITPSGILQGEWEKLENSLRRDTFYQEVSLQEMTDIVKAMNFTHTGHFYKCPNGHTFVIGECGGAMESARCPECGEAIGGRNHSLLATNSQATEYENLARQQGWQASPWPWAR